jgi:hypothetical protein
MWNLDQGVIHFFNLALLISLFHFHFFGLEQERSVMETIFWDLAVAESVCLDPYVMTRGTL